MYKEFFIYTSNEDLQGEVSKWSALQLEFNGTKTARFVLHNNELESDLFDENLDKKHVAFELKKDDAIKLAKAIVFSLNDL